MLKVAVDINGGDYGVLHNLGAVSKFIKKNQDINLVLVGNTSNIPHDLKNHPRISLIHTESNIEMSDSPVDAIKNKKQSSIHLALQSLKQNKADIVISSGNTGALVALTKIIIGTKPGVKRPVLAAEGLDCYDKSRLFLDLGASVDCSPSMLHQFAVLGTEAYKVIHPSIKNPKVCLLNVGKEQVKGSLVIKDATRLISEDKNITFAGYVEGDSIVGSEAEVIVCDGFTGNIILKAIEGFIKILLVRKNLFNNLLLLIFKKAIKKRVAIRPGPAAMLLGANRAVYKVHGSASQEVFIKALDFIYKSHKDI